MTPRHIESKKKLEKMIRLYLDNGWNLRKIGRVFGISHQAVSQRLAKAGVKMRATGNKKKPIEPIDRKVLEKLYIKEKLTILKISKRLVKPPAFISRELDRYGIKKRHGGEYHRRYDNLGTLEVGEKMLVSRTRGKRPHTVLYTSAKRFGIRVSVKTIDKKTLQVTRIK